MHRSFSCVVPVTVILSADTSGEPLSLKRPALKALAHAMVYDAMAFTEDERGFSSEDAGDALDRMGISWVVPSGYAAVDKLTRRIERGRQTGEVIKT